MLLVTLFFSFLLGLTFGDEEVILEIPQGTLKGLKSTTTFHGATFYSFQGIPYAKPNVGPNKFRISEPADGWSGVRDATQLGSTCVFYCMVRKGLFGDDDCLFLNVYTPDLNQDAKRPVMFYIHGGGWNAGSGDDDLFGPDFLVEKDVILVTINYRVGAAGFLNTGDANAPGNAGLKDQVLALKWVRDNIKNFGGCPKKVTIFGQSAGATAVQYHLISPMSQGLFRSAILQSGSTSASWAISYTPQQDVMTLAEKLGIQASSTADLVQKLAEIPTKDLVVASGELSHSMNALNGDINFILPSVESEHGQEVFLPAEPFELIKSGKIADVPIMYGVNAQEAGLFTPMFLPMAPNFENHFEMFIPKNLNVTDAAMQKQIGDSLKEFYFKGKPVNSETEDDLTNLLSDVFFNSGAHMTGVIINSRISSPVYNYYFSFEAPFSFMKALMKIEKGVIHGDEMAYEFYSKAFKNKPESGSAVEQKTNEVVEMWTNFAKEGNPSATMEFAKVQWEPMGDDQKYLEIGNELSMKKSMLKDRMSLWVDIYKSVLGDFANLF